VRIFVLIIASLLVLVTPATAQREAPPVSPRFDVVSIKPRSAPPDAMAYLLTMVHECGLPGIDRSGTRVVIPAASLCGLVRLAYDVAGYQVAEVPPELLRADPSNLLVVEARLGGGTDVSVDELRLMLRAMLADRFKLRVHREPRELAIYALTVMKGGPRLSPCSNPGASSIYTPGRIVSCVPPMTMARVAQMLTREAGRPVIDKTGLDETYSFELRWLPDNATILPDSPPSLFTAIQEQLALKLEPQRGSVDSVVIDYAEAPSPN
jgi:uncharacterized protein (TIGR03435 family)